jgi:hypothetical protein
MPNKTLLFGILGLFIAALGLLTYIALSPNDEGSTKDRALQTKPANKSPQPRLDPLTPLTPLPPSTPAPNPTIQPNKVPESDPISDVLSNERLNSSAAATKLLEILPRLDADRQSEAAHHIANLSDDVACSTWSKMVVSNSLPQPTAEVLFNDMLNRPHELLMPFLGAIADQPAHPLHKDSTEVLETLFGQPPQGTSWSAWVKNSQLQESSGR